jgi:beta-phosphoglucomutase family hydrolase
MLNDLSRARFDAVLCDLDGVITATATIHAACWKRMLDAFLDQRTRERGEPFRPFDIEADYRLYVDGKPRSDGAQSFLESRGIRLPRGTADSPEGGETVVGLAKWKDRLVTEAIAAGGVEAYPGSLAFLRAAREVGLKTAVVSSSRNCLAVLRAAGIESLFDTRVDGEVASRLRLAGKPAPDTFLHAAAELGVAPARAAVVEDAIAGVQAGRAGKFGLVVGVDREGQSEALRANGAHLVVADLSELVLR